MGTATLNGITFNYLSEGTGQLVMFLHGFPEYSHSWQGFLNLGFGYRAVAPDLRGIHETTGTNSLDDYHISNLVEDVRQLIGHLGSNDCILVGHDWGGLIAWYVAHQYPELISKLILINAVHPVRYAELRKVDEIQRKASHYIERLVSAEGELYCSQNNFEAFTHTLFASPTTLTENEKANYLNFWKDGHSLKAGISYYRSLALSPKPIPILSRPVKMPVRIIWGQNDHALQEENLDSLERFAEDLKIVRIENGSHWVHHRYPQEVLAYLKEFLPQQ